jgi:DNA-binding beta-propeller fold protein YncE
MRDALPPEGGAQLSRRFVAVGVVVSALVSCAAALAGSGMLTQLSGTDGCVNDTGADGCAVGRHLAGARAVAVSPDGTSVYLATSSTSDQQKRGLVVFSRDPETGVLTQLPGVAGCFTGSGAGGACTAIPGLKGATAVAVSPDGRNVYLGGVGGAVFARNPVTGALSLLQPGVPYGRDVVVSPDGKNVYTPGSAYARDPASGALTPLGPLPVGGGLGNAVAISPDGRNVYTSDGLSRKAYSFVRDPATGELTQLQDKSGCLLPYWQRHHPARVGTPNICTAVRGLYRAHAITVSPDGTSVYVAGLFAIAVLQRDPQTGDLSQRAGAAGIAELGHVHSLASTPDGTTLYAAGRYSSSVSVFSRDPGTGALTAAGSAGGRALTQPMGLALGGSNLYVAAQGLKSHAWPKTTSAIVVFTRN